MKVSKKKLWGLLGLFLVAAITSFAVWMPRPDAAAVQTATDTVKVRVTGEHPRVDFVSPESGTKFDKSNKYPNIQLDYENVDEVTVELTYKPYDGGPEKRTTINDPALKNLGGRASSWIPEQFDLDQWGYGHFQLHAAGHHGDISNVSTDDIEFDYVTGSINKKDDQGNPQITSPDVPDPDESVQCVEVHVWDDDGNEVTQLRDRRCRPQDLNNFVIPFDKAQPEVPDGHYKIEIESFDKDGERLHDDWYDFDYKRNRQPHVKVEDNGNPHVTPDQYPGAKCMKVHVEDINGRDLSLDHQYLGHQDCVAPFEDFVLPFDMYTDIPDGLYDIVVEYFDDNNGLLERFDYWFYYHRNITEPGIPGTDDKGNPNVHPGDRGAQCIVVKVKGPDGRYIPELEYEDCDPPFEDFTLDFSGQPEEKVPDGHYQIEVHYFEDKDKKDEIQPPDIFDFDYKRRRPGVDEGTNGNPHVTPNQWPGAQCVRVHVYDSEGNIVPGIEYEDCTPPFEDFTLPFDQFDLPDGDYKIVLDYYDEDDNWLGRETIDFHYVRKNRLATPLLPPNTGGLFGELNITRTDFLMTGLVIFLVAAGGGAFIIYRRSHKRSTPRRRR